MSKPNETRSQELAKELFDRTVDFINEELYEMLLELNEIEDLDDEAIDIMNAVMKQYWAHHITEKW